VTEVDVPVPRLNRSKYFIRHGLLFYLWVTHQQVFSYLKPTAQLELHLYFLPTVDIEEHELASYRDYISMLEPSLAHKAGKHFVELTRPRPETIKIITNPRKLRVTSIMHPEPDLEKLARVFLALADNQMYGDDCKRATVRG
jgi:hypothetical protein